MLLHIFVYLESMVQRTIITNVESIWLVISIYQAFHILLMHKIFLYFWWILTVLSDAVDVCLSCGRSDVWILNRQIFVIETDSDSSTFKHSATGVNVVVLRDSLKNKYHNKCGWPTKFNPLNCNECWAKTLMIQLFTGNGDFFFHWSVTFLKGTKFKAIYLLQYNYKRFKADYCFWINLNCFCSETTRKSQWWYEKCVCDNY